MNLDPLAEHVARVALSLPEAHQLALAGGGAMLAHQFVDRLTSDIDLFTPDAAEVAAVAEALTTALTEQGYDVTSTDRRGATYARLSVAALNGRCVDVEIAVDARIRDTVELAVGQVLHPEELAADKTLALFGRGYARDLVDVVALTHRYAQRNCSSWPPRKMPASASRTSSRHWPRPRRDQTPTSPSWV